MHRLLIITLAALALVFGLGHAAADSLSNSQTYKLNHMHPAALDAALGTKLGALMHGLPFNMSLAWYGADGIDVGAGSDGTLIGALTPQSPTKFLLSTHAYNGLNGTADTLYMHAKTGGTVFTTETTDANDADVGDCLVVDTSGAQNDCVYLGNATKKFTSAILVTSTAGNFVGTVAWQYWKGSWAAIPGATDGTSNLSQAGTVSFAAPADWVTCEVNSVTGYWIRGIITAATSGGGATATKAYTVVADADVLWTDDTTDATDADAGDVAMLPLYPVVGDATYIGKAAKFCKAKYTISQAMTVSTGAITIEYSKAAGAWGTLTCSDQGNVWKAGTSTYFTHWTPPSDWAQQTVNGTAAYWIRFRLSTAGVTAQPLGTRFWVCDLTHGLGVPWPSTGTITGITTTAQTISATNSDSKYTIINLTKGTFADYVWTQATNVDSGTFTLPCSVGDEVAITQWKEDGSTEFANINFVLYWR